MNKLLLILTAIAALAVSCGQDISEAEEYEPEQKTEREYPATEVEPVKEETVAEQLWPQIRGREDWPLMPGTEIHQKGTSPHGAFLTTYINEKGLKAINDKADSMPNGVIVAKDNYDEDKEHLKLTAMYKKDGEWYWLVYSPEGQVLNEGDIESCRQCHGGGAKDMLFYWEE